MSLRLENYRHLRDAFDALRREYTQEPPWQVETFLLGRMRTRRRLRRARIWSALAAVAALVLLAVFSVVRYRAQLPISGSIPAHISSPAVAAIDSDIPGRNLPLTAPTKPVESIAATHPSRRPRKRPTRSDWADEGGFVAIPYAEPLAPSEQVDVYRVELPRATLTHYGLPARVGSIDSPVTADVAVGSDGVVRAIRFIH